jgi:HD superfamily phosphohydrolase
MTGVEHGGFDLSWLLANLEIGRVSLSVDEEHFDSVPTLVVGPKALEAAEAYVLGLFHLYFTVYYHKTTRAAECMIAAIWVRLAKLVSQHEVWRSGLSDHNPLVRFLEMPDLTTYLELDDAAVWASIREMTKGMDQTLRELASRLLERKIYEVLDISSHLDYRDGDIGTFRARLSKAKKDGAFEEFDVLEDSAKRNPYERRHYGTPAALEKVHIRIGSSPNPEDLGDVSDVVRALREKSIYRIFVRNKRVKGLIENLLKGEKL